VSFNQPIQISQLDPRFDMFAQNVETFGDNFSGFSHPG
jgi:hypothetical protein